MTGAVGTANSFVHLVGVQKAQRLSDFVMGKVGLKPALITDQVVSRKVYAEAGNRLTQAAMTGYKFAQDVYDLCRPEIGELMARTPDPEKVGSSAMPGKVVLINPIHAENAMSLARVVKGLASIGYDFIGLRQERSLDNSGGERVWIPQAFIYTDEVLGRCTKFAKSMVVREDAIARNLDMATRYSVTEPMLMMLVQKGMGRQEAHRELQRYAIALWERPEADPVDVLAGFDEISSRITPDELRTLTSDHRTYTGAAEEFIDRVLQEARF
jgi:adenylosuccinate lyase